MNITGLVTMVTHHIGITSSQVIHYHISYKKEFLKTKLLQILQATTALLCEKSRLHISRVYNALGEC